jgi:hypothetical protein
MASAVSTPPPSLHAQYRELEKLYTNMLKLTHDMELAAKTHPNEHVVLCVGNVKIALAYRIRRELDNLEEQLCKTPE